MSREPDGAVDLGPQTVERLAILRLTEVEVHAVDLNIGVEDVERHVRRLGLPMRFERLALRLSNSPVPEQRPRGAVAAARQPTVARGA